MAGARPHISFPGARQEAHPTKLLRLLVFLARQPFFHPTTTRGDQQRCSRFFHSARGDSPAGAPRPPSPIPHHHITPAPPHAHPQASLRSLPPVFLRHPRHPETRVLLYDFIQPWAPAAASAVAIPAVLFLTTGAASCSFFHNFFRGPRTIYDQYRFPSSAIYLEEHDVRKISSRLGDRSNGLTDEERFYGCCDGSTGFIAIKTFREIESKYMDYLSTAFGKEIVPVGPLVHPRDDDDLDPHSRHCPFMSWLEGKKRGSTVFVSFGTEYFMSEGEIEEVGSGLEISGANFIWVVRFPAGGERRKVLREVLPSGFSERVGSRGLVVEGWAPQGKILGHSSVGGFLSHCGWSSVMEGMWFGVPLIALPLQLDQPLNARLAVELGVGVEVKKEGAGGEGKLIRREEVAKTIREVMTSENHVVRGKAKEMSGKMRAKGDGEIDVLVEKLIELCNYDKPRSRD